MKTQSYIVTFSLVLIFFFTNCTQTTIDADYGVVPLPQEITNNSGDGFNLNRSTIIVYPESDNALKRNAQFLADYLKELTGMSLKVSSVSQQSNQIQLITELECDIPESYSLSVTDQLIMINGVDPAGVFHGIQTLRKSIPIKEDSHDLVFPAVDIRDYPRFPYRGMHLDVARHFFTTDEVKEFIDILALHNINRFHWHLTDNQGWRIEIKKYPELTEIGSKRAQTQIGKQWGEYDGIPHGGYYTQEEIKDIVAYAQDRYIDIIPEIDVPGHTLAALASLPYLGCTGGPYKVSEKWGVMDDVLCAGNEEVYTFLENVFSEVVELFPSEYIHIGGDECPKTRWKSCPKCQAKIKQHNLIADKEHTTEERLQSYLVQRLEKFLNGKGRRIIGWDEILEGGIAPDATIMSWRGVEGGIAAAKQGHDAIMTPVSYAYFDYYQVYEVDNEPLAFGGYIPLEKVYRFEPLSPELTEKEQKHIIGVQANIWTEYILTAKQIQYMLLPRLGALSEVQWTLPGKKDYAGYLQRQLKLMDHYEKQEYNYATHIFDIKADIEQNSAARSITVSLSTVDNAQIYYTLDGSVPTVGSIKYDQPFKLIKSTMLKAIAFRNDLPGTVFTKNFVVNKATFKKVEFISQPVERFTFRGASILTDGVKSHLTFPSGEWVGFSQNDFDVVVDLEEATTISSVAIGNCISVDDWIFGPLAYHVFVSNDNKTFKEVFSEKYEPTKEKRGMIYRDYVATFTPVDARYVKAILKTLKPEDWKDGVKRTGYGFVFADEIRIE